MQTRGEFHFVTPLGPGLLAKGKGSASIVRMLSRMLEKRGIRSEVLTSEELIARGPAHHERAHALLHFNELSYVAAGEPPELATIEAELETLGYRLHHRGAAARVVGDKRRQNAVLTAAGVPMPRLLRAQAGEETVFSNEAVNAHVKVDILPPGSTLDDDRYNTTLVDTVHEVHGRAFHVSLRAICFGAHVLYAWPRCRDVAEGDPSVHTGDTPADLAVISELHARLVLPNMLQIARIAHGVSQALGCNFYAHDLLPCARTGRLLLCETNLKFYDGRYRWQMRPISRAHPVADMFNGRTFARRASQVIVSELFP